MDQHKFEVWSMATAGQSLINMFLYSCFFGAAAMGGAVETTSVDLAEVEIIKRIWQMALGTHRFVRDGCLLVIITNMPSAMS